MMSSDIESGKPTNLKVVNASLNGNHYTSIDNNPLENDTSRRKFIQKVFLCVFLQLFINFVCVIIAYFTPEVSNFIISENGITLLYIFCGVLIFMTLLIFCFESLVKNHPTNLYYYSAYSVCTSYLITTVCVVTDPQIVLLAMIGTLVITLSLTLFAMQTKVDYTPCGAIMFMFLIILVFGGFISSFLPHMKLFKLGWCLLGLFVFSFYIIIDVQMIVGGDHIRFQFEESDYILAALCLYLDIINLFLRMIELLQYCKDN